MLEEKVAHGEEETAKVSENKSESPIEWISVSVFLPKRKPSADTFVSYTTRRPFVVRHCASFYSLVWKGGFDNKKKI
jgi:hypothetical protein